MNTNLIENAIQSPCENTIQALLNDEATVFWVDWKEEDDAITEMCENILQTGRLRAEVVETDTGGGYDITIQYGEKRARVPLTYSMQDRHITLCSLNTALAPEWEIRFCIDSNGSDTLAFLPLSVRQWEELERRYNNAVATRFYKFSDRLNLFTDSLPF